MFKHKYQSYNVYLPSMSVRAYVRIQRKKKEKEKKQNKTAHCVEGLQGCCLPLHLQVNMHVRSEQ